MAQIPNISIVVHYLSHEETLLADVLKKAREMGHFPKFITDPKTPPTPLELPN